MLSLSVNWLSIVLATVASMALGMVWYMVLAKQWVAATGKKENELLGSGGSALPFVFAAICQLVMAYFIVLLTPALMGGVTDVTNAVTVGIMLWAGFSLTTMVINHRYQNMSWMLTLIDGGYMLGVVIVQGIVIGLFG
ncbi:MAG TPA: DUF1761 domain-containing protein [Devosia sp.]|nr:DUF1761 domain-containing protein [Devosia sp.]